ncbi:MAG: sigma-70 family RNA polymerase sigma factor [Planctomycetales bacterium]|nr:sigma-70 family RNA polymerase sigma factor [Planctomycetales bacterium]
MAENKTTFRELKENNNFQPLMRLILPFVSLWIHKRLQSLIDERDLAQKVLMNLTKSAESGKFNFDIDIESTEFKGILFQTCKSIGRSWCRSMYAEKRGGKFLRLSLRDLDSELEGLANELSPHVNETPAQIASTNESITALRSELDKFSTESRNIIDQKFFLQSEKTFSEIGEDLGKTADSVRMKLYRIFARLRSSLANWKP